MNISGWGNFPKVTTEVSEPDSIEKLIKCLGNSEYIPRGSGRSYGDSSLSEKQVINISRLNHIIEFKESDLTIECYAGITIDELLKFVVPRGCFLQVTPGTKFVTLGGAISSDVHGKNHHKEGCFSESVEQIHLLLPSGEVLICSKVKHANIFKAVCGGMGLIGVIIKAKIKLKKITSSHIEQVSYKTSSLYETLDVLERSNESTYTVAWVDALNKKKVGRGIVYTGEHSSKDIIDYKPNIKCSIPRFFPSSLLNKFTIKCFNNLIYHSHIKKEKTALVDIDKYFYPLDSILNWNNMYGKKGFLQYQFVMPKGEKENLQRIMKKIAESGKGSFLAVLKIFGKGNENYLSFPIEGYTLALDFKNEPEVIKLLERLDIMVAESGGRIYLTKDARMPQSIFEKTYPYMQDFKRVREFTGAGKKIHSLQSKRLGL